MNYLIYPQNSPNKKATVISSNIHMEKLRPMGVYLFPQGHVGRTLEPLPLQDTFSTAALHFLFKWNKPDDPVQIYIIGILGSALFSLCVAKRTFSSNRASLCPH